MRFSCVTALNFLWQRSSAPYFDSLSAADSALLHMPTLF